MKINLNKVIKTLKGETARMSYPSRKIVDALPKNKNAEPDYSKLPDETIKNIILCCLENYKVEERREAFYVNMIAESVLGAEKGIVDMKDKLNRFLVKVLNSMMIKAEKDTKEKENQDNKNTGIYWGWVIAQVLTEMGLDENDEE